VRILFLSQRVPYPPNRGDKITTWRLVERMGRQHSVRCIAFAHDAADVEAASTLTSKGFSTTAFPLPPRWRALPLLLTEQPLTLGVFGSPALQAAVDRAAPECDLAYAYSSSMGAFLEPHAGLRRVMHFAELDSDKWRQYAQSARWPMRWVYAREARALLAFERRIAQAFDENVFCTPLEQALFQQHIPGQSSLVLKNGVDFAAYRPSPDTAEPGHIVFVGVMDYHPNADACVHFVRDVLPLVREQHPGVRFTIVGARPTPAVQRLAQVQGVTVTGFVDDPREYLRRAALSVAPLRIARGIQNKVLEALAMGLPVVGTTAATQGVAGEPGRDYLVADGAATTAEAVSRLLADPAAARALGARARAFVEAHYDWEAAFRPLDALLDRLAPEPRARAR
jgi:sugar transferase (PEP-CTERM/EpsH1 system associated)